jgi:hypothetical protein
LFDCPFSKLIPASLKVFSIPLYATLAKPEVKLDAGITGLVGYMPFLGFL